MTCGVYLLLKLFELHFHVLELLPGVQKLLALLLSEKKETQREEMDENKENNKKKKIRRCNLETGRTEIILGGRERHRFLCSKERKI